MHAVYMHACSPVPHCAVRLGHAQVTLRGVRKEQLGLLQREIDLLKLLKNP